MNSDDLERKRIIILSKDRLPNEPITCFNVRFPRITKIVKSVLIAVNLPDIDHVDDYTNMIHLVIPQLTNIDQIYSSDDILNRGVYASIPVNIGNNAIQYMATGDIQTFEWEYSQPISIDTLTLYWIAYDYNAHRWYRINLENEYDVVIDLFTLK